MGAVPQDGEGLKAPRGRPGASRAGQGRAAVRRVLPALAALLAGCLASDAINKDYDRTKVRRIGVLAFDYAGRTPFGAEDIFAKHLLDRGYHVVERARLESVMREQNLSLSGLLAPGTAKGVGQVLGVDAVLIGSVTAYEAERKTLVMVDSRTTREEPVFETKPEKRKDGKTHEVTRQVGKKVTEEVKQIPFMLPVDAEVGLAVKLVDVETGEVVWVGTETSQGVNGAMATDWIASYLVKRLSKKWVSRRD
ncbi:hypothetical protein EPO15_07625 [bacterium]|nr:MAG: hypothetical protein EPO15_07625 [bacterium]